MIERICDTFQLSTELNNFLNYVFYRYMSQSKLISKFVLYWILISSNQKKYIFLLMISKWSIPQYPDVFQKIFSKINFFVDTFFWKKKSTIYLHKLDCESWFYIFHFYIIYLYAYYKKLNIVSFFFSIIICHFKKCLQSIINRIIFIS